MKKILLLMIISFAAVASAICQNAALTLDKGVAQHREIDAIYGAFSDAYRTLDVEKVTVLYSETAAYLPPNSPVLNGRDEIRPTFKSFFDWVKAEGRTMTISFRIIQRVAEKRLAYDVGIYTIRQFRDGREVGVGDGKFITVAIKGKDGKWRFQVDGYNELGKEKQPSSGGGR